MPYEGDAESVIVMFSALKEDRPVISDSDEEAEFTGREICRPYEAEETNQGLGNGLVSNWALSILHFVGLSIFPCLYS